MEKHLNRAQVADYLGMTRDTLNAKIHAGEFAEPDVIEGDGSQGWSADTVERIRKQNEDAEATLCVPEIAAELVTTIRRIAEHIRRDRDSATEPPTDIHRKMPLTFELIATRLDNEVRNIVSRDITTARKRLAMYDSALMICEVSQMPLEVGSAPTANSPAKTDSSTRSARLRIAADTTASVTVQLPSAMNTPVARQMTAALVEQRDKILYYADALDAEATATP